MVPAPPFEIGAPRFHFWPTGCCLHPILYFENVAPLLVFGSPCCYILAAGLAYSYLFYVVEDNERPDTKAVALLKRSVFKNYFLCKAFTSKW